MSEGTPRILVCDDTPAKRYVITSWLRRAGYTVVQAESVAEALETVRTEPIDLAVLDVHLPDGSGLDITRTIKDDPQTASIPVIHVSAVAIEIQDRVSGLDQGGDAYLIDPIVPEEMLSTVRALLRSSGARRSAEAMASWTGRLNRAAVRLHLAPTVPRLAEAAARAAADITDAPAAVLICHDKTPLWAAATPGGPEITAVVLDDERADSLLAAADTQVVRSAETPWSDVLPVAAGDEWRLWPILGSGARLGFVAVANATLTEGLDGLVERLGQLTSVAVDNLLALEREHQTAMLLQRSLLPAVLPQPDGLSIAARYRASQRHAEVGGDFFDAFMVREDCWVVIGDVQGHSLEAAVVMAELRYSLRAYAYDGYAPAEVLDRVDVLLERNPAELIATAWIARVAPGRRAVEIASAGHLPLLLARDGTTRFVETPGTILGVSMPHTPQTVAVRSGDRIVLVTDGLVERRGEGVDPGLARLAAAVKAGSALSTEALAQELVALGGASDDDVAVLVVDVTD
jgi:DNA-binding response OmpR family regulator